MSRVVTAIVEKKIQEFGIEDRAYANQLILLAHKEFARCLNNLPLRSKSPLVAQEAAIAAIEERLSHDQRLPILFPAPLNLADCG